jgi:hypothetical protein
MPTIEERLQDTGRLWREHVDTTTGQQGSPPSRFAPRGDKRRIILMAASAVVSAGVGIPVAGVLTHRAADHNISQVRIPADYPLGAARITTHAVGPQSAMAEGSPIEPIRLTVVR